MSCDSVAGRADVVCAHFAGLPTIVHFSANNRKAPENPIFPSFPSKNMSVFIFFVTKMVPPPHSPVHPLFAHTSPGLFIDYVNLKKKKPYYVRISLIFVGGTHKFECQLFPQKKKKFFWFYFVTKKAIDFSNLNGAT
jgi:hypothetical protein